VNGGYWAADICSGQYGWFERLADATLSDAELAERKRRG